MPSYLEHPLLKPGTVEKRLFQLDLAVSALRHPTMVVLPTGLGKTVVALMAVLARLESGRVLMLAPTRPLVEQHTSFFKSVVVDPEIVVQITGEISPDERASVWHKASVVVSTPQVIENDLLSRRIDLSGVSLIIFDEAHRATGNYAYVYIAARYQKDRLEDRLVLGITASPGSEGERIEEICSSLGITNIETRNEDDPDVAPFVHHREIEWVRVNIPDQILRLRRRLEDVLERKMDYLMRIGAANKASPWAPPFKLDLRTSKGALLDLQKQLSASAARRPNQAVYQCLSMLAEILKLKHAVELAETQGMAALSSYFVRLQAEARSRGGSKASRRLMEDPEILEIVEDLSRMDVEHPKLAAVREILNEQLGRNPESRIIVFTNYRDTATALLKFLKSESGPVKAVRFVGQSSRRDDTGLSQKKQVKVLEGFRLGEYNVLIATSVGEEGIDIPSTDMVLFYEPVPSEIRSIQRKGRTGRARAGRVVVMIAKGTRDEAYYWISDRKERSMQRQIRSGLSLEDSRQTQTDDALITPLEAAADGMPQRYRAVQTAAVQATFDSPFQGLKELDTSKPTVIVDPRERDMARRLESLGVMVTLQNLEVGDYVLSDRLGLERKTAEDFAASIMDPKRGLFRQIKDLARNYERPVLILEGSDIHHRMIHPNAIRGALASIATDFGVSILPTSDTDDTAATIALLARREQSGPGRQVKAHGRKTARTLAEQQEYLICAIPSIGPAVAKGLLVHFGSVEAVLTAPYEELLKVEMVGPKTAQRIRELAASQYKG